MRSGCRRHPCRARQTAGGRPDLRQQSRRVNAEEAPAPLLSSEVSHQNLWQNPYFRHNMQSRPVLTFAAMLLITMVCAVSLRPVDSSGQEELVGSTGSQSGSKTGQVHANGASVRQIGFRDDRNWGELEPPPPVILPPRGVSKESQLAQIPPAEDERPPFELGPIPESSPAGPLDPATLILETARERLISYESIRAQLVQTVAMDDHRFRMKGIYLQGANLQLRLDCQVQVGSTTGKMTEVCDGQILWTWQQIGEEQRVTRRNVRQIERAASSAGMTTQNLLLAELGFGGLPAMIASLQKSFQFDRVVEQDVDGLRFVVMDGVWQPEIASRLGGSPQARMPDHIPDRVRIYFQKDKLFPRRILHLKLGSKPNRYRPLVSLDFVNVVWDGPLDETAFEFNPPENVRREDITQEYIRKFTRKADKSGLKSASEAKSR